MRLQVAALRDEVQARELAERLSRETGLPGDSRFDAESGLYRVRIGHFSSRDEAERGKDALEARGVTEAWIVTEGAGLTDPALVVTHGQSTYRIPGRWLRLEGAEGWLPVKGKRYRGAILVYLNDRGTLNVINELSLEDYLRGVVPLELGPEAYPELEALKAQAVAARTYAVRNRGEFRDEGYDICATPRCQVYGGMGAEHPLSDRAIDETAGEVLLYQGLPVDALYSSTCGGHTENVEVVFPLKSWPYLRGVPCSEGGHTRLEGQVNPHSSYPEALVSSLLPADGWSHRDLAVRLSLLASEAGIPASAPVELSSLEAREVRRAVTELFDLALDSRLLVAAEDLPYLLEDDSQEWQEEDRRLAALFVQQGLDSGSGGEALSRADQAELLLHLGSSLEVLDIGSGWFRAVTDGKLVVRVGSGTETLPLAGKLLTFREINGRTRGAALTLVPGDRLTLVRRRGQVEALVQHVNPEGVAYDRSSKLASWRRFRSDSQLRSAVEDIYPGLGFSGLQVGERGVSGRVGSLRILGSEGRSETVEGLAVRWTLDLPDTLFTATRLEPPGKDAGWLFRGRGWGHGVGMCQVGSFGMAIRGRSYREILGHYYTGVVLGSVGSVQETVVQRADAQ